MQNSFIRKTLLLIFLFAAPFLIIESSAGVSSLAHIQRMNKYNVGFYWLDLEILKSSGTIKGNALTRAKCVVASMDTFALELANNLTIDSIHVAINGGIFLTANYVHIGQELNVFLPSNLLLNQEIETRVFYHGNPTVSIFYNSGFYSGSLGKFAANPPYNSNTWWPCKQNLTDQADSSWFYITTSSADKAISNGLLTNLVDTGNGKNRWEWKSKYPINSYLIAFVITSEDEVVDYWYPIGRTDSLLITSYGYTPENAQSILQVYSDKFGLYPFYEEKLGFALVNLGGGIENQTLIASNGGVDEHEMAHQWFGNRAGCSSWRDVMLSEGLATWAESVYSEYTAENPVAANLARKSHYVDNTVTASVFGSVNMDTTTVLGVFGNPALYYRKGAMVINSLRFHINNDESFFQGIRNYVEQFGGSTANGRQFRESMEASTGVDLVDFFNQWYYKGGAPTFNIAWNQIAGQVVMQITQTTNSASNPLYKTPVEILVQRTEGDTIVRLFTNTNLSTHQFSCAGNITGFAVDPNQWITNGNGTVILDQSLALNVDDINSTVYRIYPNPIKDYAMISANNSSQVAIKIFSMTGKLVYSNDYTRLNQFIDMSELASGTYVIQIENGDSKQMLKMAVE